MKFSPEMRVVKFGSDDVIATSGATRSITLTNFGDGTASNGTINYNGVNYVTGDDSAQDFLNAYGASKNAGINSGSATMSVNKLFEHENSGTGVDSQRWNGTYTYDPDGTWQNSSGTTLKGLFSKQ